MKFSSTIALLLFFSFAGWSTVYGQSATEVIDEVGESFIDGSVERLIKYFDERVEITMWGRRQEYSRAQAQYVMTQFFQDYPSGSFGILHRGTADGVAYALGELRSSTGTFEVNIFVKMAPGSSRVTEIRFDER
jgi:hypothetical protein